MEYILGLFVLYLFLHYGFKKYKSMLITKQEKYIDSYTFPNKINEMIVKEYPHLTNNDVALVIKGLKEYFIVCHREKEQTVAMPSQVIDVAWHEFILFTKKYNDFCKKSLGKFLHHTPAEAMKSQISAQNGIKLAWKIACQRESINPTNPSKLPLLFAIDGILKIPDGFKYSLNCNSINSSGDGGYCASHIACSSGGDGSSSCGASSCSSGCGGGGD